MGLFGIRSKGSCSLNEIIEHIEKHNVKALCKILKSKNDISKNPYALDYTEDAIKQDLKIIYKYISLYNPEKKDLAAAIVVLMFHNSFNTSNTQLREADFPALTKESFSYLSTLLHVLKSLDEFESVKIKQYQISTCGDQRTCDKCEKMNGKIYPVSNAIIGKNAPPFCKQYRCIIRPVYK